MLIHLNKKESDYLNELVIMSEESLKDICDEDLKVKVNFMTQAEVDKEFKLINKLSEKLK